jgi:hypothetical protein
MAMAALSAERLMRYAISVSLLWERVAIFGWRRQQ